MLLVVCTYIGKPIGGEFLLSILEGSIDVILAYQLNELLLLQVKHELLVVFQQLKQRTKAMRKRQTDPTSYCFVSPLPVDGVRWPF